MPDEPMPQLDGAEHREKHLPDALKANVWKKGHSGNPNGKPKGTVSLKKLLIKLLNEKHPGDKQGRKNAEVFVLSELNRALKGDKDARKMIWEYVEGMPNARVDVNSTGTMDITLDGKSELLSRLSGLIARANAGEDSKREADGG